MDILTKEQRSETMRAIKSKDSKIEIALRKELWKRGLRGYRKNYKKVFGKPDIVYNKYKVAIFCDSEFWHGKDWEERKEKIQTNRDYWIPKIERNKERDVKVNERLKKEGWIVLRFWGKSILKNTIGCVDLIEQTIITKKSN